MKKVLLFSFIITGMLYSAGTFAQTSFGVKGGIDLFNMTIKDPKVDTKAITAFNLGAFADLQIADGFYIRPELAFAQKGAKEKNFDNTFRLSYLEVPVSFLYKGDLSDGKVLVGVGPYIALGVGGKVKSGSFSEKIKFKNEITFSESEAAPYFKPLDFGGKVYAGYEMKNGISLILETSLGMTNIQPKITGTDGTPSTIKNVGFGLNLAYKIK